MGLAGLVGPARRGRGDLGSFALVIPENLASTPASSLEMLLRVINDFVFRIGSKRADST